MEKFIFNDSEVYLPEEITQDVEVLKTIVSKNTWENHFTDKEKRSLLSLLPDHEDVEPDSENSKMETLNCLLNGDIFHFENPLESIFNKFKAGYFKVDSHDYIKMCQAFNHKQYQQHMDNYYDRLLQHLLLQKQMILTEMRSQADSSNTRPPPIDHQYNKDNTSSKVACLKHRTNKKCFGILKEIKEKLGHYGVESSDDDDDDDDCGNGGKDDDILFGVDEEELDRVVADIFEKSSVLQDKIEGRGRRGRPRGWGTELVDVQEMVRNHRKRKLETVDDTDQSFVGDLGQIVVDLGIKKQDIIAVENKAKDKKAKRIKKQQTSSQSSQTNPYKNPHYNHNHYNRRRRHHHKNNLHHHDNGLSTEAAVPEDLYGDKGLINGCNEAGGDEDDVDEDYNYSFGSELGLESSNSHQGKVFPCFFSLLCFSLCKRPSNTASLEELQADLREWLVQADHNANAWVYECNDWSSLVHAALLFLAGSSLEGQFENTTFKPMVRLNDNSNQNNGDDNKNSNSNNENNNRSAAATTSFTWIKTTIEPLSNSNHGSLKRSNSTSNYGNFKNNHSGHGNIKDSNSNSKLSHNDQNMNDLLSVLNYHWSEIRKGRGLKTDADGTAAIPPSLVSTDYVVGPSSAEEKALFRIQERERFSNPHKAFTYHCHGYNSVVGPVKGIYSKESSSMKARGHALLVAKRPHCVNILTLVNDCAARLPNGQGTRYEICELMKDSQYISPDITDAQLNAVVSGALDRLHYDKDPSVKYLSAQKIWVYRHRNRTAEEFERMHMVQRLTARARKLATSKKSHLSLLHFSAKRQHGGKLKSSSLTKISQAVVPTSQPSSQSFSHATNQPPNHTSNQSHMTFNQVRPPMNQSSAKTALSHLALQNTPRVHGDASRLHDTLKSHKTAHLLLSNRGSDFALKLPFSTSSHLPSLQLIKTPPIPTAVSSFKNQQQNQLLLQREQNQLLLKRQQQLQQLQQLKQRQPKPPHLITQPPFHGQMSSILKPQIITSIFPPPSNNTNNVGSNTHITDNIRNNSLLNSFTSNKSSSSLTPAPQHVSSKTFNINAALAHFKTASKQSGSFNILPNDKLNPMAIPNALKLNDLLKISPTSSQQKFFNSQQQQQQLQHKQQQQQQQKQQNQFQQQQQKQLQQQKQKQNTMLSQKLQQQLQMQQKQMQQKQKLQAPQWIISNPQQQPQQISIQPQQLLQRNDNQVRLVFQQQTHQRQQQQQQQQQLQSKPQLQQNLQQQQFIQQQQQQQPQQLTVPVQSIMNMINKGQININHLFNNKNNNQ